MYNLISDIGAEEDPFKVRSDLNPAAKYKELGLLAKMTYDLTDELQLRSITGYRELKATRAIDLDVTQAPILHSTSQQDDDYFSQELQMASESDRLNVLGGLSSFDRNFHQKAPTYASVPFFFFNVLTFYK